MNQKITNKDLILADKEVQHRRAEYAKKHSLAFVRYTMPNFQSTDFHKTYYKVLNEFVHGRIKKLIVSVPPQHGKSLGSSINVPAQMIGRNPELKIATVCYSATKARKFGRKTKQLLAEPKYKELFPDARMAEKGDSNYVNTAEEIEMVGCDGSLKMVGYQGGLTGDPVDVLLMDDLYKDWKEANSPLIRDNVTDWYLTVADTRLHNNSQQLIVFTRWHEDDLVGYMEANDDVIEIKSWSDIDKYKNKDVWFKINFEAIKTTPPTEIDPRGLDAPLWPDRHSLHKLQKARSKDPLKFECLYQGNPGSSEGVLYQPFKTYKDRSQYVEICAYVDTADQGDDYLCAIIYGVTSSYEYEVIEVIYTQDGMEVTEPLLVGALLHNQVNNTMIESNNGGRGFARNVDRMTDYRCGVRWFHQSDNKEGRILSNATNVTRLISMPHDWYARWPIFYKHITQFKRLFKANKHDDAPDTITGIIEHDAQGQVMDENFIV